MRKSTEPVLGCPFQKSPTSSMNAWMRARCSAAGRLAELLRSSLALLRHGSVRGRFAG
ncbi:MAG: hypothetical protein IPK32_19055 [Verrucomicrobiaceae bacterium]|nr:hypothetical protein [Verrucomicrobiaceae bacterium]